MVWRSKCHRYVPVECVNDREDEQGEEQEHGHVAELVEGEWCQQVVVAIVRHLVIWRRACH